VGEGFVRQRAEDFGIDTPKMTQGDKLELGDDVAARLDAVTAAPVRSGSIVAGVIDGERLAALWTTVAAGLRVDIGARTFDHWLKHLKPVSFDATSGSLTLSSPSAFIGDQIEKRFADRLQLAWRQVLPGLRSLKLSAHQRPTSAVSAMPVAERRGSAPVLGSASVADHAPPQLDPRLTFNAFVQGRSNVLALNAARRMTAVEAPQFHPLYLRAETGQGKTHLLHSIAAATLERDPGARIILMSAEKFMMEFVGAMRANDMMAFKARLRAADLLLIDDLQFVIGKDSTQIELLHTFDDVMTSGGRLVVAADRLPHRLDGIDQRLLSRLAGGLVADIDPPDQDLRAAILERKAAALGVMVPTAVLDWIAHSFPRNVRELEGALNKLLAYAALTDTPIDLAMAQERLAETARGSRARITIEEIQRAVCAHYRIDKSEMASQRRTRAVARPRQVAMYLAKELTPRSFPEIGRRFGGRDHSTVIHAVRTIESLRVDDADLDTDIRRIRRALTA
jgi:chromosomal replication initiator protein